MNFKKSIALMFVVAIFANTLKAELLPVHRSFKTEVTVSATAKVLTVRIKDTEISDATVTIMNTEGVVVFNEKVEGTQANLRKYNLKQLEVGNYTLTVKRKRSTLVQPFAVAIDKIEVLSAMAETRFTPVVVLKDNFLNVSASSFNKPGIGVSIADNYGTKVFESTYEGVTLQKRFDLSKLQNGAYVVEVTTYGGEVEYFPIVKN
jgi:Domain of unknown function (DUF3244)